MIEPNRPLCIMDYIPPRDISERYSDVFKDFGKWTLGEEPYSDGQFEWESCDAGMRKDVDGKIFYLKCMEPAVWYVSLGHYGMIGPNTGSYCEFHKPRVREAL